MAGGRRWPLSAAFARPFLFLATGPASPRKCPSDRPQPKEAPMRLISALCAVLALALLSPLAVLAQDAPPAPALSVPRLVNVSAVFQPADGQPPAPVEVVTLSIYAAQDGGLPLWQEMQTVTVDTTGRFTVLLGASHPDGLPPAVFASGEARWMSLLFARPGEVESPRTRITSVPYALKASDAETLGGRPASAYLLAPTEGDETAPRAASARTGDSSVATAEPPVAADLVLPGTTNFLAKYVNGAAGTVGNANIFEINGRVGMGTGAATPFDRLHLRFTDQSGAFTGLAVQNLGNTNTSYSGMLFYDQFGAVAQFQGFNNVTHEYRINNIASNPSINFMLGGTSRLRIGPTFTDFFGDLNFFSNSLGIGSLFINTNVDGIALKAQGPIGLWGATDTGLGVYGTASSDVGWAGYFDGNVRVNGVGIALRANGPTIGVWGSTENGLGIYGTATNAVGWAGYFDGNVNVNGILSKSAGAFRIDHPLDPENKYLSHSFVESPDMKNIYDGWRCSTRSARRSSRCRTGSRR